MKEIITLKTKFDLPIGTRFRFDAWIDGGTFEVVEDSIEENNDRCEVCDLYYPCYGDRFIVCGCECEARKRKDGKDVYFKRVERCGEEWTR